MRLISHHVTTKAKELNKKYHRYLKLIFLLLLVYPASSRSQNQTGQGLFAFMFCQSLRTRSLSFVLVLTATFFSWSNLICTATWCRRRCQSSRHSACMMNDMLVEIDTRTFKATRHFVVTKGQEKGLSGPPNVSATPSTHSMCGMPGHGSEALKPGDNGISLCRSRN